MAESERPEEDVTIAPPTTTSGIEGGVTTGGVTTGGVTTGGVTTGGVTTGGVTTGSDALTVLEGTEVPIELVATTLKV